MNEARLFVEASLSMRKPSFGLLHRFALLTARVGSLALFLFWGAFFLEHLAWFEDPSTWPPPQIWLAQGLHLLFLIGYLLSIVWDVPGSVLIAAGVVSFFGLTGGSNALGFALISLLPIPFYVIARLNRPTPAAT